MKKIIMKILKIWKTIFQLKEELDNKENKEKKYY